MKRFALVIFVLVVLAIILLLPRGIEKEGLNRTSPQEEDRFSQARKDMVRTQLMTRDIIDSRVLEIMGNVPRHDFVPYELQEQAYKDRPLPIGEGQTISQPYIVAFMTQALDLNGNEIVLEIGTGSGYQAAILREMLPRGEVYTIEIIPVLAERANETLKGLGYDVFVKNADGYFGWEGKSFDAIMITAAVNHIPKPLIEQLKDGGKLILPLGSTQYYQTLVLVTKKGDELETKYLIDVRFVPMTGEALKRT